MPPPASSPSAPRRARVPAPAKDGCPVPPDAPTRFELHKQRLRADAGNELLHLLVRGSAIRLEATGRVEHLGQQSEIAYRVEEDARLLEDPVDRQIDVLLLC